MSGPGLLIVMTGPSGTGKSSVVRALLRLEPKLRFSVSHTTRAPRPEESEGVDYHFVSPERFEQLRDAGELVEWAEVHGHLYGTARSQIDAAVREGAELLLDIDVQGARQVGGRFPDAVSLFLLPPDYSTLESRLRGRGSDDEGSIARRLRTAAAEVRQHGAFRYLIVNDSVERAAEQVRAILAAERMKSERRADLARRILSTFPSPEGEASAR